MTPASRWPSTLRAARRLRRADEPGSEAPGLADTNFANATGWPDPPTTPVRSTWRSSRAPSSSRIRALFPVQGKGVRLNNIKQPNRNLLLWRDSSVDGLKTATRGSRLLPGRLRQAQRSALIAVVFGTDSEEARANETAKLLGYGFNFFESKTFFKKGETVQTVDVWKGAARTVKAGVAADFAAALPKRAREGYQTRVVLKEGDVIAPVARRPLGVSNWWAPTARSSCRRRWSRWKPSRRAVFSAACGTASACSSGVCSADHQAQTKKATGRGSFFLCWRWVLGLETTLSSHWPLRFHRQVSPLISRLRFMRFFKAILREPAGNSLSGAHLAR